MDTRQIINYINDGANFYCRQLGNADHMMFTNNGTYSIISPKAGEEGGTSVFDVSLEHLSDIEASQKIEEIKALNVHTWWGMCVSDRIADLIWGKDRPVLSPEQQENAEEVYMAIFPEDKPVKKVLDDTIRVKPVISLDEFGIWADICNAVLHDGYPIMHRVNHFDLCEGGIMPCYIGFFNDIPAAVCAIMNNHLISSLEFVATLPDYRKKGLAKALTMTAINDAFDNGSIIITTRAFVEAKNLYKSLGFKLYYI